MTHRSVCVSERERVSVFLPVYIMLETISHMETWHKSNCDRQIDR